MKNLYVLPFLFDTTLGVYDPANDKYHLPPLGANSDLITVSGFSSGSFTSAVLQATLSETIKGAGLLNGGILSHFAKQYYMDMGVATGAEAEASRQQLLDAAIQ